MLELSSEQQQILDVVESLARREFADRAFESPGVPPANVDLLAEQGFLGINFDEAYGGGGLTEVEALLVIRAVGRVCPDTAAYLSEQQMIGPRAISMFGSEAAKERFLPPVIDGETGIAIAISEPEAGSDVTAMTTSVTEDGDRYLLSGEKTWVSRVPESEYAVVWTRFPDGNVGSVVMPFDDPGVEISMESENMAGHTQTQFYMEEVPIPAEHVLTQGEGSLRKLLDALNWERISTAAVVTAAAHYALDSALEYAGTREQFGQPIGDYQGIEWKLADAFKQLEAARTLTDRAVRRSEGRGRVLDPVDTNVAKLFATEVAEDVIDEALQVHGANGYQKDHPLEYLYRFVRGYRIAGGTDEILKNTIAKQLKREGLPELGE